MIKKTPEQSHFNTNNTDDRIAASVLLKNGSNFIQILIERFPWMKAMSTVSINE